MFTNGLVNKYNGLKKLIIFIKIMFSASKSTKPKSQVATAPKAPCNINSSKKYASRFGNQSFDTAQALVRKSVNFSNDGSQKKFNHFQPLGLRASSDDAGELQHQGGYSNKRVTKSTEFFLMPLPSQKKSQLKSQEESETSPDAKTCLTMNNPMIKKERNALALLGNVDFCLKMHKLYANTNALWSVFGKLIKIFGGTNRFEQNLVLRNNSGDGPVLKGFFYDFGDNIFRKIQAGDTLRLAGRFLSDDRFHVYKVEMFDLENSAEDFTRIQNVISFVLLQNHMQETKEN